MSCAPIAYGGISHTAARPHYSVLDKTKIKQTYNIEIPYWEESLEVCVNKLLNDKQ